MTFGSLFAGIGGFDLGLEWAGMECKWQVEINPFCNRVLAKHWPYVRRYLDVKEVHGVAAHAKGFGQIAALREQDKKGNERNNGCGEMPVTGKSEDGYCPSCLPPVDLICGGFPCQPYSCAGKRRGEEDDRALWPEMLRVIREVRPRWVIGENVGGFVNMGLDGCVSDLEAEGYEVQPFVIPACAVNAPHRRDRVWIVAHRECKRDGREPGNGIGEEGEIQEGEAGFEESRVNQIRNCGQDVADSPQELFNGSGKARQRRRRESPNGNWWSVEPDVGRVAHGVPNRVDRLKSLGNAVVPQIPYIIGKAIMEIEEGK
jgi:DNA (cytosine-5)-methyltransferase 1